MKIKSAVLTCAILICCVRGASAQQWQADFRGVTLTLGESRTTAVQRLQARFQLRPLDSDSSFLVLAPEPGEPFHSLGSVVFSQGRLVFVSRSWPADGDRHAFATVVTRALAQLADHEGCTVSSQSQQGPEGDSQLVIVYCSGHEISISSGRVQGYSLTSVMESWYVR